MADPQSGPASLLSRAAAHAVRFRETLDTRPQRPERSYVEALAGFEAPTPEQGLDGPAVIDELVHRADPGLAAVTGRRFFGWVMGSSDPVGVAADWVTAAWGQNSANHVVSPSASAAETVATAWLLDILDLPRDASIGFATGATMASFACLAAARDAVLRRAGWDAAAQGLFGAPPIRVAIGDDAHTTIFSALQYLGLGHDRVLRVPTDAQGRMQPAALERALAGPPAPGPAIVITQAGQINTGAFDPFAAIVPIARAHGAWVHVDGAFGLWARACPDRRGLTAGIEEADSWATDGHKWLQTPYDSGYAIVADAGAHRAAMTMGASYLPAVAAGERSPADYVPELSRRARGFATWAMIRHLGRAGIAAMVGEHCRLARRMAARLAAEPGIAVVNDVVLNQVAVRFGAGESVERGDDLTRATIAGIQADGVCYAGGARWRGQWIMRLSVISRPTTEADADRSVEAIVAAWRRVGRGTSPGIRNANSDLSSPTRGEVK